jgi:small neutral amino acid transporter SnatA (MarC family)
MGMNFEWKDLLLSILPLFVALDAPGVVPIFMALTSEVRPEKKPNHRADRVDFIFAGRAILFFVPRDHGK